jgi:hypothetical protein
MSLPQEPHHAYVTEAVGGIHCLVCGEPMFQEPPQADDAELDDLIDKIAHDEYDTEPSLRQALLQWRSHSLEIARLEGRQTAFHDIQAYTDPSHQKMSPFIRLKTADQFINKELAQLQAALDKLKEGV